MLLSTLSQPIPADGSQEFHLAAQLAGELGSASGGRLFLRYNGGAPVSVWQNTAPFSGNQNVNHAFTPPAGTFRLGTEVVLDKGHLTFSNLTLSALSAAIPHSGLQTYSLAAGVNGVLASANGGRLFVKYNTGTMVNVWQNMGALSGSQTVSGNFTPTSGVSSFQVGTEVVLDKGHLTFSDVTLTAVSAAITARPGQLHDLFAQVSGQLNSANGGRLFVKYSNGTIGYEWQNAGVFNGSQNVNGNFTTPSGVSSFQVGTEVVLDKGYLAFSSVVLRALSDPIAVTAGDNYQFAGQVAGSLVAPVGQGGQIVARYSNAAGGDAGVDVLWDNPANFNGTAQVQQTFNANPGATTMRLMLITNLDAGHLTYSNFGLQHMVTGFSAIQRTTYSVAGQSVAVKVAGDPVSGNNGIVFTYSDHLGSASVLSNASGGLVPGSEARYLPFGGWRTQPTSNPGLTDMGFTGHKHNNSGADNLGLIYMNARYYVPYINRFVSADTIVPDPANPQSFNRYSYVENRPLNFSDPTGHCAFGTDENGQTIITKFDCTVDDFQALTWDERVLWVQTFVRMFDLGNWIDDIGGVIEAIFKDDSDFNRMDGYTAYVDAGILQALNDGWNLHEGRNAVGSVVFGDDGTNWTHGGAVWKAFFDGRVALEAGSLGAPTLSELERTRLRAEQYGVDYASSLNESQRRFAQEPLRVQIRIETFVDGANYYRANCPCEFGPWRVGPREGFSLLSKGAIFGDIWSAWVYGTYVSSQNPYWMTP